MSAKFDIGYDPSDSVKGLKALENALKNAEKEGAKLPPELLKMVERAQQVATATEKAATKVDKFDAEIAQLYKDLDKADDQMGSFAVSTYDAAKAAEKATASVNKMETQVGALTKVSKAVGSTREGMEKLAGAAAYLGDEASGSVIKGMNTLSGVMLAVSGPAGALAAIVGSSIVLWNAWRKEIVAVADPLNDVDKIALDIAQSLGYVNDEAYKLAETLKKDTETVKNYAKSFDDVGKRSEEAYKSLDELGKIVEKTRESYKLKLEVEGIESVAEAEQKTQEILEGIEQIKNRQVTTVEERSLKLKQLEEQQKRAAEQLTAIEAKRIQLLEDARTKEKEAAVERQQRTDEAAKRSAEHQKETIKNIEEVSKAEEKSDDAKLDREREITKERKEQVKAKEVDEKPTPPQPQAEAMNPYGEGQAPTAGQQTDPYGGQLGMTSLPSFGYKGRGVQGGFVDDWSQPGMQGGSGEGANQDSAESVNEISELTRRQALRKAAQEKAEREFRKQYSVGEDESVQGFIDRSGSSRQERRTAYNRLEQDARGEAVKGLKSGDDEDVQKAIADTMAEQLQQQTDSANKNGKLSKDILEASKEMVDKLKQQDADLDTLGADLQELRKQIGAIGSKKNGGDFGPIRNKAQRLSKGY